MRPGRKDSDHEAKNKLQAKSLGIIFYARFGGFTITYEIGAGSNTCCVGLRQMVAAGIKWRP